ncbi:MAG TPA: glycosyltransferase family 2 protein [Methylomirabilota bacterium]|nr:glycosyltransferase family 2 protein [Methylomirabilota bacterium]
MKLETPAGRPLVSIVTPFFNTAPHLAQCIESVLNQTYQNWEYVLADNCSTDASTEIAISYATRDPRIRLIRETEFLDQLSNYNRALTYLSAESRYCKMVQADDWIFPNCLEEMVRAAEWAPDVAVVGSLSMYEERVGHDGLPYGCHLVPGIEMLRRFLLDRVTVFGSPTCVMFRSSDVSARCPFFEVDAPFADADVCFDLLQTGQFAFVHQVLTFNRRQAGSTWVRLAPHQPMMLLNIMFTYRYGPSLFPPREFEDLVERALDSYYHFLSHAVTEGRPREFWDYHAAGLARVGQRIDKWRLRRYALRALLEPVKAYVRMARAMTRRTARAQ